MKRNKEFWLRARLEWHRRVKKIYFQEISGWNEPCPMCGMEWGIHKDEICQTEPGTPLNIQHPSQETIVKVVAWKLINEGE